MASPSPPGVVSDLLFCLNSPVLPQLPSSSFLLLADHLRLARPRPRPLPPPDLDRHDAVDDHGRRIADALGPSGRGRSASVIDSPSCEVVDVHRRSSRGSTSAAHGDLTWWTMLLDDAALLHARGLAAEFDGTSTSTFSCSETRAKSTWSMCVPQTFPLHVADERRFVDGAGQRDDAAAVADRPRPVAPPARPARRSPCRDRTAPPGFPRFAEPPVVAFSKILAKLDP